MSLVPEASAIVTFLRNKMPDPLSRSGQWIWVGYPRSPDVSYPAIAITPTGGTRGEMSIGDTGSRYLRLYSVEIWTDTDTNFDANSHTYAQSEMVLYLADLIKNAIRDYACEFRSTYNKIDLWTTPARLLSYNEELDIYRAVMGIRIQTNDPKA